MQKIKSTKLAKDETKLIFGCHPSNHRRKSIEIDVFVTPLGRLKTKLINEITPGRNSFIYRNDETAHYWLRGNNSACQIKWFPKHGLQVWCDENESINNMSTELYELNRCILYSC